MPVFSSELEGNVAPDVAALGDWLLQARLAQVPVCVIGDMASFQTPKGETLGPEQLRRLARAFDLPHRHWLQADGFDSERIERENPYDLQEVINAQVNPFAVRIEGRREYFGYEIATERKNVVEHIYTCGPSWQIWKRQVDNQHHLTTDLIAMGPAGAWVSSIHDLLEYSEDNGLYRTRWDIDPYAFITAAFQLAGRPIPDVTTAFGARIAFSHIDGDAMRNMVQDVPGPQRISGVVIRDDILRKYPLPVTVAPVVADADDELGFGNKHLRREFQEMLALPNVEVGSHTWLHPLKWELETIAFPQIDAPFDLERELSGSVAYITENLAPVDKPCVLLQWSGDCRPTAEQLAAANALSVPNINGGDSRLDAEYDSVSFVSALMRTTENGEHQVYAAACNENLYTNLWTENFGGFIHVLETFRRSEIVAAQWGERRILPVNVYYHFYLGERFAALEALRAIYQWTLDEQLHWVTTREYVDRVHDWRRTVIVSEGAQWRIRDYGTSTTMRFDNEQRVPDLQQSQQVLGYVQDGKKLYVHLAEAKEAVLVWRTDNSLGNQVGIQASTAHIRQSERKQQSWQFQARWWTAGYVRLTGFPPGTTVQVALVENDPLRVVADNTGVVTIPLPAVGDGQWREVSCVW